MSCHKCWLNRFYNRFRMLERKSLMEEIPFSIDDLKIENLNNSYVRNGVSLTIKTSSTFLNIPISTLYNRINKIEEQKLNFKVGENFFDLNFERERLDNNKEVVLLYFCDLVLMKFLNNKNNKNQPIEKKIINFFELLNGSKDDLLPYEIKNRNYSEREIALQNNNFLVEINKKMDIIIQKDNKITELELENEELRNRLNEVEKNAKKTVLERIKSFFNTNA